MPQTDFYNWNAHRAYPLQEQPAYTFSGLELPEGLLLDAGFVLGVQILPGAVRLTALTVTTTELIFQFTLPDESTMSFACGRGLVGPTVCTSEDGDFIVVGGALDFAASLPNDTYQASSDYPVEEGTVQSLYNSYVRQLNLGSEKDDPGTLPCAEEEVERWDFAATARGITGFPKFKAGYNAVVSLDQRSNTLKIGVQSGRGEGLPCGRLDLEDVGELSTTIIPAETLLECVDGISTFNGVSPSADGKITLSSGPGITIIPVPEEHKLILSFLTDDGDLPFCGVYTDD